MNRHSAIRGFALSLESLSDRIVPAATAVQEGTLLTITGDSGANVIEITDDGTELTVVCDGEEVVLDGPVTEFVLSLGSGNDEVSLTFSGALEGTRTFDVSLGNGHDTFTASLGDGAVDPNTNEAVPSSLADGAVLELAVRGMNGHDSLSFNAASTDVGAGATLSVELGGGNGKDTLDYSYGGIRLGDLTLSASGGNGKDEVSGEATFDATSTGTADLDVMGGNGKDTLALLVTDDSGDTSTLAGLTATVDGGRGADLADVLGDVEVIGAKTKGPK